MRRLTFILFALTLLLCCGAAAAQDSLSVAGPRKPVGFDAGNMVRAGRSRAANVSTFVNDKFYDNLSISVLAKARVPSSEDVGYAYNAGLGIKKWLSRSLGARVEGVAGFMPYNRDGGRAPEFCVSGSALFNISSYIGGYDLSRFCELTAILGAGYSTMWKDAARHFIVGNLGIEAKMKFSDRFSVNVEPYIPVYVNRSNLSYGFGVSIGASYDFSSNVFSPACGGRYFLTLSGGMQLQNSELVRQRSTSDFIGMHFDAGIGRRFTDFFDLRMTATYSRNPWQIYRGGRKMPSQYYAIRLEGVFDFVGIFKPESRFGAGALIGPEAGIMFKKDLDITLREVYVGLSAGLHADCRVGERVSLFLEPRYTFVPYTAPNDNSTSFDINRNYYDALFNLVLGLEINLGL